MTKFEICARLDGREYGEEITAEIEEGIKWTSLVVVFGASDDIMKFYGAIDDEISCYNGGTAYLGKDGLIENQCSAEDCPYFNHAKEQAKTIEACWCDEEGDIAWTYKTEIPHGTFEIFDDEGEYCRGIVFDLKDL